MRVEGKTRRLRERLEITLPVRLHCRESDDHGWVEKTRLIDITPFGARLAIGCPTEPGRLLHLTMPLPSQLRSFDYTLEQYNVWGLVRHARMRTHAADAPPRFEIGVAFIGKDPPLSFESNPAQRYEITNAPAGNQLWGVREQPDLESIPKGTSERRSESRRLLAADVLLEIYETEGKLSDTRSARTENVSRHGMAVVSDVNIARGRYVRVRNRLDGRIVIAAVRRLRPGADGLKRLHLEFLDQQEPQWSTPVEN